MTTRSNRSAASASRLRSRGSNACASTPFAFRAASTIDPLFSETSRSALLPPSSTPTFPNWLNLPSSIRPPGPVLGARPDSPCSHPRSRGAPAQWLATLPPALRFFRASCSRRVSDDAHLGHEADAEAALDLGTRVGDQRFDVGRGRLPLRVHDEVRVLLRDARAADREALQPAGLDEARGVVAGWVAEHRPRVREVERLRLDAARKELLDSRARLCGVAGPEPEPGGGEPLFCVMGDRRASQRAMA